MSNINPYSSANANPDDDVAMNEALQGGSASATGSSGAVDPPADRSQESNKPIEEEVDFENEDFAVPPSFARELLEESLKLMLSPTSFGLLSRSQPRKSQGTQQTRCSTVWLILSRQPPKKINIFVSFCIISAITNLQPLSHSRRLAPIFPWC